MKIHLSIVACCMLLLAVSGGCGQAKAPQQNIKIGAWYFGGWSVTPDSTGHTFHISPTLTSEYVERMPEWGWREDSPAIMEKQIDYAADAGLDVWGFCWYETGVVKQQVFEELNTALDLFVKAPNKDRLEFFLLSCQPVSPESWPGFCEKAIAIMKQNNYLRIDSSPIFTFFNSRDVIEGLGGESKTRESFDYFRKCAMDAGLGNLLIGAVTSCVADTTVHLPFRNSGFDFLTTYNNSNVGRQHEGENEFANLSLGDKKSWETIAPCADSLGMKFLPSMTAGYDMRPWAADHPTLPASDYWYVQPTPLQIADQLNEIIEWTKANRHVVLGGNLSMIYAWNENGEGGWLTPTREEGSARLDAIRQIVEIKRK